MNKEQIEQRNIAIQIAIDAGVLKRCEHHSNEILNVGADVNNAFTLGNELFSKGEFGSAFTYRRDMTVAISDAVKEHTAEECPECSKS